VLRKKFGSVSPLFRSVIHVALPAVPFAAKPPTD
jgi:hypothetical protein